MYNLLSLPIFFLLAENTQAQPCKNKMDDANCEHWAGLGYCQSRGLFMLDKCQHACNSCPKGNFSSPRDRKRILLRGIHTKALPGLLSKKRNSQLSPKGTVRIGTQFLSVLQGDESKEMNEQRKGSGVSHFREVFLFCRDICNFLP